MSPTQVNNLQNESSTTEERAPVGITVITGFLGSGKSTLIRRILTEDHGMRLVVVENEFGANTTVEEAIVTQGIGPAALEQFIELPNGCICCAAQDDLTDSLSRLLRTRGADIDHILVEASGLADPGPIAASFWVDDELETGLRLDAVVAIADAVNVEGYLSDEGGEGEKATITRKQLVVADLVVLNKMDLVTDDNNASNSEAAHHIEQVIRQNGSASRLIPTTMCNLPLSELINIRAYDQKTSELELVAATVPEKFQHHVHPEKLDVGSVSFRIENAVFDPSLLDRVFGLLLWEMGDDCSDQQAVPEIWRMKSLVVIQGERFKRIYQSVHSLFDHSESSIEVCTDERSASQFIFIGKALTEDKLKSYIESAIVTVSELPKG